MDWLKTGMSWFDFSEGAILQTGGSKTCIVTSTLKEVELYAGEGFDDILYAYPLCQHHVSRCYQFTKMLDKFHIMLDNWSSVEVLEKNPPPEGKKWSVFLKVNAGNNRGKLTDVTNLQRCWISSISYWITGPQWKCCKSILHQQEKSGPYSPKLMWKIIEVS